MAFSAELTRETAAQAVAPSSAGSDLMGDAAGANISVAAAVASAQSDPAPRDGLVIVGMGAGMSTRIRIDSDPTATATDPLYVGPNVWHFPIARGDRVSFFGDAGITTANVTVCMAKG